MTAPLHPGAQPAKTRPTVVTISSYLLYFYAVLQVISIGVSIPMITATQEVTEELYAGTAMEGSAAIGGLIGSIFGLVIGVLLAAGVVALAIFNNRGKNPSRIITWVVAGLAVCCSGFGLLATAAGSAMSDIDTGDPNLPTQAEMQERLEAALPGWYEPVNLTIGILGMLAILAAAILLALPAANEFFRKPPAMWEPPLPGTAYPGYPMSGQYPGYPQAQQGYPQAQPGYPQAQPGYPQAQPGHPSTPSDQPQPGQGQPQQDQPGQGQPGQSQQDRPEQPGGQQQPPA